MLAHCITTFVTFVEIALKPYIMCQVATPQRLGTGCFPHDKDGNRWKSETQWKYQQAAAKLVLPTTNHTWFEKIWEFSMALKTKVGCSMD